MLKPALVPMWRSDSALQFGLGGAHARVLEGFDHSCRVVLRLLDGTREIEQIRRDANGAGVDSARVDRLLDTLARCCLLDDAAADAGALRQLDLEARDLLGPELAALSLMRPAPGDALAAIFRRRNTRLAISGPPVLTERLAELLKAAGLTTINLYPSLTELAPRTIGRRAPEFVVLATIGVLDYQAFPIVDNLAMPHLAISVRELTGIVGPLVRPGATSCLHCQELHRCDRDPSWPSLARQFRATADGRRAPAALAAMVAATATVQVLSHLDGDAPATVEGSLEVTLADWRVRRRSWHRHPDCPCNLPATG